MKKLQNDYITYHGGFWQSVHRCFVCDRASNFSVTLSPTSSYAATRFCNFPIHRWVSTRTTLQQESSKPPIKDALCIPPDKSYEQLQVRSVGMYCWQDRATTREGPQGISAEPSDRVSMENGGKSRVRRTGDVRSVHMHVLSVICYLPTSPGGGTTTTPKRT